MDLDGRPIRNHIDAPIDRNPFVDGGPFDLWKAHPLADDFDRRNEFGLRETAVAWTAMVYLQATPHGRSDC